MLYNIVIDIDKEGPRAKWPTLPHHTTGDDNLTQAQYRQVLERGEVPGQKYFQITLDDPQSYICFKAEHKKDLGTKLINKDGPYYKILPHLGRPGYNNLYIVYWPWERKNRPRPPTAVQVMSGMTSVSGAGLGGLWASRQKRHVIAVVASKKNTLIKSNWPIIKEWNGPISLQELGCYLCEWYSRGASGSRGKRPGKVDVGSAADIFDLG